MHIPIRRLAPAVLAAVAILGLPGVAQAQEAPVRAPQAAQSAALPQQITAAAGVSGGFHPLTPSRILDTREGIGAPVGKLAGNASMNLAVNGYGGVPDSGVIAVVLNVTVTGSTQASYLTVYPAGYSQPTASNLNFVAGQTVPNLVTVGVDPNLSGGQVVIYNHTGSVDVIADVSGYYSNGAATGDRFNPMTPSRIMDTRNGTNTTLYPLGNDDQRALQVTSRGGVPASGVSSVVMNVTITGPTTTSYLTVWPDGSPRPVASNLNYTAGDTRPNLVIVPVGTGGKVDFYNHFGLVNVIADVVGWYDTTGTQGSVYHPLVPGRAIDTIHDGFGQYHANEEGSYKFVDGANLLPTNTTAIVMNLTDVNATEFSYATVWPDTAQFPTASNLNYGPGQINPNLVVVALGTNGDIALYNHAGNVDFLGDLNGYYTSS